MKISFLLENKKKRKKKIHSVTTKKSTLILNSYNCSKVKTNSKNNKQKKNSDNLKYTLTFRTNKLRQSPKKVDMNLQNRKILTEKKERNPNRTIDPSN